MDQENIQLDLGRWFRLHWRVLRSPPGAAPCLVTTVTTDENGDDKDTFPDPLAPKIPQWMKPVQCSMRVLVSMDDDPCDFPDPMEPLEVKDGEGFVTGDDGVQRYLHWRDFGWRIKPESEGHYKFVGEFAGPDGEEAVSFTDDVVVARGQKLSPKRQRMIDLIDKWMPCSLLGKGLPQNKQPDTRPRHGDGSMKSLLELAGWTEKMGNESALNSQINSVMGSVPFLKEKTPIPIATSCGDTVKALLELWGSDWEEDGSGKAQAFGVGIEARKKGWYVDVFDAYAQNPPLQPKPGDILVLRQGDGPHMKSPYPTIGSLAHVCVIVSVSSQMWVTADGGGGVLPDQVAKSDNEKSIGWTTPNAAKPDKYYGMPWDIPVDPGKKGPQMKGVKQALAEQGLDGMFNDGVYPQGLPCLISTTDMKSKMIDGWVDLDRVPNLKKEWNEKVDKSSDEYKARMAKAAKFADLWGRMTKGGK